MGTLYACPVCGATFAVQAEMEYHYRGMHAQPTRDVNMVGDIPVPIPVVPLPPPPIPLNLPSPAPVVEFLGSAEHSTWDHVWGWVKGASNDVVRGAETLIGVGGSAVTNIAESYVGNMLKALSGYINDAYAFTEAGLDVVTANLETLSSAVADDLEWAVEQTGDLWQNVWTLGLVTVPALLTEIARIGGSIEPLILGGLANVETWAIDNIYDPLADEVARVETQARTDLWGAIDDVYSEIKDRVNAETLARIASLAGLAAAVAAVTSFVEDCGEPICGYAGPKTDIGKFLKGLAIAGDAALLYELANLDEAGVNHLLSGLGSAASGVVSDFADLFIGGGDTIGETITHAVGELL